MNDLNIFFSTVMKQHDDDSHIELFLLLMDQSHEGIQFVVRPWVKLMFFSFFLPCGCLENATSN